MTRTRPNPRPLDAPRLEELALSYVARFATSAAKLDDYLRRKLRERLRREQSNYCAAADRRVFVVFRELTDVVLVCAGTARAEDHGGARTTEARREWRLEHGLAAVPPIAVVSASARLDPASRLFTDTSVPPLIFTTSSAPSADRQRLADAGATVLELGENSVDSAAILDTLDRLGLRRVLCEGGPSLFGRLIADDVVDDFCLTL